MNEAPTGSARCRENKRLKADESIISVEHKFVFVPIQKVASSSIKRSLFPASGISPTHGAHLAPFPATVLQDLPDRDEYYKFTFVRNPWDRLVSCYRAKIGQSADARVTGGLARFGDTFYSGMSFDLFARAVADIPDAEADRHFSLQTPRLLVEGAIEIDFIGRFEHLARDFSHVIEHLRLDIDLPVMKGDKELKGPRKRVAYRNYYTPELAELTAKRYAADVELLGYEF